MACRSALLAVTAASVGFFLSPGAVQGAAAAFAITDATVKGGKLIVTGTTTAANQPVKLDDQFTATSNGQNVFTFSLSGYHPANCVVQVKWGSATQAAVVANCGELGLSPRGAWAAGASYLTDDLVTHQGSSWRAKRVSK